MTWGLLRIKNEARWIDRVIQSIQPVCNRILILDDHSDDGTPEICESLGCTVFRSEFEGIHEARDKDYLLEQVWAAGAKVGDWCLMIDGDEMLYAPDVPVLLEWIKRGKVGGYSLPILYLWDSENQVRVDGVYKSFRRPSVFRLVDNPKLQFQVTEFGGNFHCSSVPQHYIGCANVNLIPARLLHFGYMHKADRIRKYEWYNHIDPNNKVEDGYRHMVVGDVFPATSRFHWAGPLEVACLQA